MKYTLLVILFLPLLFSLAAAAKEEPKGSKDHPMISRYAGSKILKYSEKAFDEYPLFVRKASRYGGKEKNLESTQRVEGKVTRIAYQALPERSTLEVFRNYSDSLTAGGFTPLFECQNKACGGRNFNHSVAPYGVFGEDYEDQRFLSAKLIRDSGDVYVSLYTVMHHSGAASENNRVRVQLDIIESKAMQTNMVTVDADAMAKGLGAEGHIAIYAIHFATDSALLKANSKAALDEVSKLLKQQPSLKLLVVGHTDNVGGLDYNKKLSRQRAAAVVGALVKTYGIASKRLLSDGVAYLAPVASNRSESGRAKNRRVELVEN